MMNNEHQTFCINKIQNVQLVCHVQRMNEYMLTRKNRMLSLPEKRKKDSIHGSKK